MSEDVKNLGWVRLPRDLMDTPVAKNANLWRVYSHLFTHARYKDEPQAFLVGLTRIMLHQGELIFGRNKCADSINMKPSTVYDQIQKLIALDLIEIRTISEEMKNVFSIVKVVGYKERFRPEPFEMKEIEEAKRFNFSDEEFSPEEARELGLANLDLKDQAALYEPEHYS